MRTNKIYLALFFILALSSLVSAIPGIPHQFYGDVIVNDQLVPDNTIIIAEVGGDEYVTVTKDGKYGYAPNIFYVEDPEGDRVSKGELIEFYIGGMLVDSYNFETNGYTNLDFSVTTTCGDSYCLGDETCSSCLADCGVCTGPPVITIHSPINKVYNTLKVGLEVSSDQEIIAWVYALNSINYITFTPNITLTAQEGSNTVSVIGINQVPGISTASFSVELSDSSSSSGSSSSSSSSSSPLSLIREEAVNTGSDTNSESSDENQINVGGGMTGGVIGFAKTGTGIGIIIVLIIVLVGILGYFGLKKRPRKQ